jgi:peptidoglycan hydrolase-like protein with peptidoglycan-binding domain
MSMLNWETMSKERENNRDNVRELQAFLNTKFSFLWGKESLKVDGIFGKNTDNAVEMAQFHLFLCPDGIVGPITIHWFKEYRRHNRILLFQDKPEINIKGRYWEAMGGFIPGSGYSYSSTFGGPNDPGDWMYGQAYITGDYRRPSDLASHHPELMDMGIFRPEIMTLGEYPMVKYFNKRDKDGNQVYVRAGASWALNPKSYYCAIQTDRSYGRWDEENPRILIINPKNGKAVIALRTDKGPSKLLGTKRFPGTKRRDIDLSYGCMDALEAEVHDDKIVATDGTKLIYGYAGPDNELGYVGEISHQLK